MTPEEALARIAALRNKPGASLIHAVSLAEQVRNNSEPDRAESGMSGNVHTSSMLENPDTITITISISREDALVLADLGLASVEMREACRAALEGNK